MSANFTSNGMRDIVLERLRWFEWLSNGFSHSITERRKSQKWSEFLRSLSDEDLLDLYLECKDIESKLD